MKIFMELTSNNRKSVSNKLIIYHQNVRSLSSRKDELSAFLKKECFSPHLICIREHYTEEQELLTCSISGYKLASSYCHKSYLKESVCIFIKEYILYQVINLKKYREKLLKYVWLNCK
jgi:hypothetical protein